MSYEQKHQPFEYDPDTGEAHPAATPTQPVAKANELPDNIPHPPFDIERFRSLVGLYTPGGILLSGKQSRDLLAAIDAVIRQRDDARMFAKLERHDESGPQFQLRPESLKEIMERDGSCTHDILNEDGICRRCGVDRRGI